MEYSVDYSIKYIIEYSVEYSVEYNVEYRLEYSGEYSVEYSVQCLWLYSRVFQLWKDVSGHICQPEIYVEPNFQLDAKKIEFRKGNPFLAIFLKILMGKHGFIIWEKLDILKSHFCPEFFPILV